MNKVGGYHDLTLGKQNVGAESALRLNVRAIVSCFRKKERSLLLNCGLKWLEMVVCGSVRMGEFNCD